MFVIPNQPLDGLQRWQMFVILISLVIAQLLVNIWMFYAKVRVVVLLLSEARRFHMAAKARPAQFLASLAHAPC